jgi:NDP-sugar pyrophosphorylase family protein
MQALVRCAERVALADVAGRPLVDRQIQWLQAIGCDRIVVESRSAAVRAHVAEVSAELAPDVQVAPSLHDFRLRDVVRELDLRGPVVVVPGDVLGDGDLVRVLGRCGSGGAIVHAAAPPVAGRRRSAEVRVWMPGSVTPHLVGPGWACRLQTPADAFRLGCAALEGRLPPRDDEGHGWPIEIHAAEIAHGVWVARGASVPPRALLVPPVLVGPGAVVDAGAIVGPQVVIGPRAAIERGAVVEGAIVPPESLVTRDGTIHHRRSA